MDILYQLDEATTPMNEKEYILLEEEKGILPPLESSNHQQCSELMFLTKMYSLVH